MHYLLKHNVVLSQKIAVLNLFEKKFGAQTGNVIAW